MNKLLLINGPNLNLLGIREPETYGEKSLAEVEAILQQDAQTQGFELQTFQSNHEGDLIDRIHLAKAQGMHGLVINPGGYTHSSVALRDAISAVDLPCIEVHLSNIHKREPFRNHSYISDIALGVICGLGWQGYQYALTHLQHKLNLSTKPSN